MILLLPLRHANVLVQLLPHRLKRGRINLNAIKKDVKNSQRLKSAKRKFSVR